MDRQNIKEEINLLTNKISKLSKTILGYANDIPKIEIDLLLEDVKRLYNLLFILNNLSGNSPKGKTSNFITEESIHKLLDEKLIRLKSDLLKEINNIGQKSFIKEEEPTQEQEVLIAKDINEGFETVVEEFNFHNDENDELIQENERIENESFQKEESVSEEKQASEQDLFTIAETKNISQQHSESEKRSINEKLAETKEDKTIVDKLKNQKISDLKKAIGINERFLFINELFGGSFSEYNDALEKLNKIVTLDEAISFINEQKNKYSWDEDDDTFGKFNELLNRKFL